MNMDRNYKEISLRIIDKRNAYYAKRKKVKNTLLLSSFLSVFIFMFLFAFFDKNQVGDPYINYDYVAMEMEITRAEGTTVIVVDDLNLINNVMEFIDNVDEENQVPTTSDYDKDAEDSIEDEFFNQSTDYVLKVQSLNGKEQVFVVTNNYILKERNSAVYINKDEFEYFKGLIKIL